MRGRRRTTLLISAAMLAALVVTPTALPASAGAAPVKFHTCFRGDHGEEASDAGWYSTYWVNTIAIGSYQDCSHGMGFNTASGIDTTAPGQGGKGALVHQLPHYLQLKTVSMMVTGGDTSTGFEYTARACDDCAVLAHLPEPNSSGTPQPFTVEMGDARELVIQVNCTRSVCAGATPLNFYNVETVVDDTTPPFVLGMGISTDGQITGWSNGRNLTTGATLYDQYGLGASSGALRVDDQPPFAASPVCRMLNGPGYENEHYPFSLPCPEQASVFSGLVPLKGLADGPHTLTLDGEDSVGNKVSASTPFKLDTTPPATPEDVSVGANANGWITNNEFTLTWKNTGENKPTATQSGIKQAWYDLNPIDPATPDPPLAQGLTIWPDYNRVITRIPMPGEGRWTLYVWLEDQVGNVGGRQRIEFGRDADAPAKPVLADNPWLSRDALVAGARQQLTHVNNPAVDSGVCGYAVAVNATKVSDPPAVITDPANITSVSLPANVPSGSNWIHVREISCAGLASDTATTAVNVDDVAPDVKLAGAPAGGWSNQPLQISINATDTAGSGVTTVERGFTGTPLQSFAGASNTLTVGEGQRELRFSATDKAGNKAATQTRLLRVDATPPLAVFEPRNQDAPAEIAGAVSDGLSGINAAQIEYRRIDAADPAWHAMPTASQTDPADPARQLLRATLPDGQLADGVYALRILASDDAGNAVESETIRGSDVPMRVVLPVRTQTQLKAALATYARRCVTKAGSLCAKGARCSKSPGDRGCRLKTVTDLSAARPVRTLDYGARTALVGELRDAAGNAIVGKRLTVLSSINGSGLSLIGEAVTDAQGHYEFEVPKGCSRDLKIQFEGSGSLAPASAIASLRVISSLVLKVSDASPAVGEPVVFSGKLRGLVPEASPKGLVVALDFWNGASGWQNGISRTRVSPGGDWQAKPYTFNRAVGKVTVVKVRAVVESSDTGWPYETGASRTLLVRVINK